MFLIEVQKPKGGIVFPAILLEFLVFWSNGILVSDNFLIEAQKPRCGTMFPALLMDFLVFVGNLMV